MEEFKENIDKKAEDKTCDDLEKKYEGKKCQISPGMLLVSILLFIGSFTLLYSSESRLNFRSNTAGTENVAETAKALPSDEINTIQWYEGKLVSVTGELEADKEFGDKYLDPANFIILRRIVEMYSWNEEGQSSENYEYSKKWAEFPEDSGLFQNQQYQNPIKKIDSAEKIAKDAHIGVYKIDVEKAMLPALQTIQLDQDVIIITPDMRYQEGYIYLGSKNVNDPEIGDLRISYEGIYDGEIVTAFGKLKDDQIISYTDNTTEVENPLYRIYSGTRQQALREMKSENLAYVWTFRIISFIILWIAVYLFLNPMSQIIKDKYKTEVHKLATIGATGLVAAIFVFIPILLTRWLEYYIALLIIGFIIIIFFIFGIRYMVKYNIIVGRKIKSKKYRSFSVVWGDDQKLSIKRDDPVETIDDSLPLSGNYSYDFFNKNDNETFSYHSLEKLSPDQLNQIDNNLDLTGNLFPTENKGIIKWKTNIVTGKKDKIGLASFDALPQEIQKSISDLLFSE